MTTIAHDDLQSIIDGAEKRIDALDPAIVATMESCRPPIMAEKAHVYPFSTSYAWEKTDDSILDFSLPLDQLFRLYVHVPWCKMKCLFCMYQVVTNPKQGAIERYFDCLETELSRYCSRLAVPRLRVDQIYIGGGTPSYPSASQIGWLMDMLHRQLDVAEGTSFGTEVSPGTTTRDKLQAFVAGGVNRVSMGVQSFQDTLLEKNARDHDSAGTRAAYDMIRDIGVPEVNIDLLVNLPGQTVMNFASSVRSVLELGPSCISFLDLHIPPTTTVFKKGGHYRPWREYLIRRAIYQRMLDDDGRYVRHRPHYYVLPDEAQGRTTRVTCTDTRAYQKGGLGYQLGIGMSARGHLGSVAYVNAINPAYEAIVRDGGLPLERSHVLREEDKIAMRAIRSAVDYCTFPGDPVVQQRYSRQLGFLRKYGLLDEDNNFTDDGCLFGEELGYMFYPMIEFPQDSEVSDAASWRDSRAASAAGWRAPT